MFQVEGSTLDTIVTNCAVSHGTIKYLKDLTSHSSPQPISPQQWGVITQASISCLYPEEEELSRILAMRTPNEVLPETPISMGVESWNSVPFIREPEGEPMK